MSEPTPASTTSMQPEEVKQIVGEFWHVRASDYDNAPQHVITSETVERRWLDLVASALDAPGGRILDVIDAGSGTGYMSLLCATLGHRVTGVDQSPAMVERARTKAAARSLPASFVVGDVEHLPFDDGSHDALVERHVLWTLLDPVAVLREWGRVLRPGGTLVHVGGDWSNLAPANGSSDGSPGYGVVAPLLPLMGGAEAARVEPLFAAAGFIDVRTTPLQEALYWEAANPDAPTSRYVITARRPQA